MFFLLSNNFVQAKISSTDRLRSFETSGRRYRKHKLYYDVYIATLSRLRLPTCQVDLGLKFFELRQSAQNADFCGRPVVIDDKICIYATLCAHPTHLESFKYAIAFREWN